MFHKQTKGHCGSQTRLKFASGCNRFKYLVRILQHLTQLHPALRHEELFEPWLERIWNVEVDTPEDWDWKEDERLISWCLVGRVECVAPWWWCRIQSWLLQWYYCLCNQSLITQHQVSVIGPSPLLLMAGIKSCGSISFQHKIYSKIIRKVQWIYRYVCIIVQIFAR